MSLILHRNGIKIKLIVEGSLCSGMLPNAVAECFLGISIEKVKQANRANQSTSIIVLLTACTPQSSSV